MPEIYFREMVPDDADSVAIVEEKCFSMPWSRESFWRDASNENTLYLLAVDKEKEEIIGYVGCWILGNVVSILQKMCF